MKRISLPVLGLALVVLFGLTWVGCSEETDVSVSPTSESTDWSTGISDPLADNDYTDGVIDDREYDWDGPDTDVDETNDVVDPQDKGGDEPYDPDNPKNGDTDR